jgi:hypothetical protein
VSRSVPEWIGATPDARIPTRVRLRVYEAFDGRCHCGYCGLMKIAGKPWDIEHGVALINGGNNRENNLRPVLRDHHRDKTREDVAIKSKTARVKALNIGIKKAKRPMPGSKASKWKRKMDGTVVLRGE